MNIYIICTSLFIYIFFIYNIKNTLSIGDLSDAGAGTGNPNQSGSSEAITVSGPSKPVYNNSGSLFVYNIDSSDDGGSETASSEEKVGQPPRNPEDFKVSTSDINDEANICINNKEKYTLATLKYGFKYSFNDGVLCHKVEFNNRDVWNHDSSEHGDKYPKVLYYNTFNKRIYVIFNNRWYYAYDYVDNNWSFNYHKSEGIATYFTLDIPGDINTIAYYDYTTRYYITRCRSKVTFFFKDHTNCIKVNVDNINVWNYTPTKVLNQFPKSVIYNANIKVLTVKFTDDIYYSYKLEDGEWSAYPALSSLAR